MFWICCSASELQSVGLFGLFAFGPKMSARELYLSFLSSFFYQMQSVCCVFDWQKKSRWPKTNRGLDCSSRSWICFPHKTRWEPTHFGWWKRKLLNPLGIEKRCLRPWVCNLNNWLDATWCSIDRSLRANISHLHTPRDLSKNWCMHAWAWYGFDFPLINLLYVLPWSVPLIVDAQSVANYC